ncbi:MAG: hypothetical protein DWB48_05875 [Nitrosomonas sp.]|nr:hypothetical protein [Nitrosomonas sp.]
MRIIIVIVNININISFMTGGRDLQGLVSPDQKSSEVGGSREGEEGESSKAGSILNFPCFYFCQETG